MCADLGGRRDQADALLEVVAAREELLLRASGGSVARIPRESPVAHGGLVGELGLERLFPARAVAVFGRIGEEQKVPPVVGWVAR